MKCQKILDTLKCDDIKDHLNYLMELANKYDHVTEFGSRLGCSTLYIANSRCKVFHAYDIKVQDNIKAIMNETKLSDNVREWHEANTLHVKIEPTNMLFIDTLHTYEQLSEELRLHAPYVSDIIVLHDTVTFGHRNEREQGKSNKGLIPAIEEFIAKTNEWEIKEHREYNNGLMILQRK